MMIEYCLNTLLLIVVLFRNGVLAHVCYIYDDVLTNNRENSDAMLNVYGLDQKALAKIELFDNNGRWREEPLLLVVYWQLLSL